jgi:hypothetical protein
MTQTRPLVRIRTCFAVLGLCALLALFVQPAVAHAGSLSGSLGSVQAPFWLVLVTGGGIVAASFLFATLVTDHETTAASSCRSARSDGSHRSSAGSASSASWRSSSSASSGRATRF